MQICFPLDCFEKLMTHVPKKTSARLALQRAKRQRPEGFAYPAQWVNCTEKDAQVFLETATRHLPADAPRIAYAIETALS